MLYSNIGDLPAPLARAVRLLLSLAKAPAARRQLVKGPSLNFTDNIVLFALEFLMAKVLRLLPRLRTLNVEVSVHENRHRALGRIFPVTPPSACAHFLWTLIGHLQASRFDPDLAAFLSQPEIRLAQHSYQQLIARMLDFFVAAYQENPAVR
ncbi:hypothetical protein BC826DRAFT_1103137 [Russula brevipes]|nr:hypothetical protein BC826DRAFT_1103137 [Russula brevipes]